MDVRCERCRTEYEVEDSRVSDLGTEVQCSDCGHLFVVKRQSTMALPSNREPKETMKADAEWMLETADVQSYRLRDLTLLHKWIIERRVTREDRASQDGKTWQRLGNMAELTSFFDLVESAERAAAEETPKPTVIPSPQARPELIPSTAMPQAVVSAVSLEFASSAAALPQAPSPLAPPILLPPETVPPPPQSPVHNHPPVVMAHRPMPSSSSNRGRLPAQNYGALPQVADIGETEMIRVEPSKSHGFLKLVLTMLVTAAVAYTGIALHSHYMRSSGTSSSGTSEPIVPPSKPAEDTVMPKVAAPAAEAAVREAAADDEGTAHAPVVEPITDEESGVAPANANGTKAAGSGKPQAVAAQGYLALNRRQYPQAITFFKRALANNPTNGTALFGLAEAYRGNGQKMQALINYRRYIALLPNGPDASTARHQVRQLDGKKQR